MHSGAIRDSPLATPNLPPLRPRRMIATLRTRASCAGGRPPAWVAPAASARSIRAGTRDAPSTSISSPMSTVASTPRSCSSPMDSLRQYTRGLPMTSMWDVTPTTCGTTSTRTKEPARCSTSAPSATPSKAGSASYSRRRTPERCKSDRRRSPGRACTRMSMVADRRTHCGSREMGRAIMSDTTSAHAETEVRAFRIDVPEREIEELHRRIDATRWPTKELVADRSQGVQLAAAQELARYWTTEYDWRRCEARLNALPQFKTKIDGLDIHFIHVESRHETALPLVM